MSPNCPELLISWLDFNDDPVDIVRRERGVASWNRIDPLRRHARGRRLLERDKKREKMPSEKSSLSYKPALLAGYKMFLSNRL